MNAAKIYEALTGMCSYRLPYTEVEDLFEEGKACDILYNNVYDAKLRLNQRLGTEEDRDIELMISCLLEICRIVAYRMYPYGAKSSPE